MIYVNIWGEFLRLRRELLDSPASSSPTAMPSMAAAAISGEPETFAARGGFGS